MPYKDAQKQKEYQRKYQKEYYHKKRKLKSITTESTNTLSKDWHLKVVIAILAFLNISVSIDLFSK